MIVSEQMDLRSVDRSKLHSFGTGKKLTPRYLVSSELETMLSKLEILIAIWMAM